MPPGNNKSYLFHIYCENITLIDLHFRGGGGGEKFPLQRLFGSGRTSVLKLDNKNVTKWGFHAKNVQLSQVKRQGGCVTLLVLCHLAEQGPARHQNAAMCWKQKIGLNRSLNG